MPLPPSPKTWIYTSIQQDAVTDDIAHGQLPFTSPSQAIFKYSIFNNSFCLALGLVILTSFWIGMFGTQDFVQEHWVLALLLGPFIFLIYMLNRTAGAIKKFKEDEKKAKAPPKAADQGKTSG